MIVSADGGSTAAKDCRLAVTYAFIEVLKMKNEKKKKKGFFSAIKESMLKTGGCCGPGETCGGSEKNSIKPAEKDIQKSEKG